MAQIAQRPRADYEQWRNGVIAAGLLTALGLLLAVSAPERIAAFSNFTLVFLSLLIEAVPFILVGAVVSAAIEVFVPVSAFERIARLPHALQLPAAGIA